MTDLEVPVLIVGGGGAGLSASMFLSHLNVPNLLISRRPETSKIPKAHMISQRSMEIFTELGVADTILEKGTPAENMKSVAWYAGVNGDHDGYGQRLGRLDTWGGGYTDADYVAGSPCRTVNLQQLHIEPILKNHAESYPFADIRFNHELTSLEQDDEGVTSEVVNRGTEERYRVRSRYLLGADGGRTVGDLVGLKMSGETNLMRMVSTHFTADLSPYLKDEDVILRWLINPEFGASIASGVLVPMGPTQWGTHSEEWVFHLQFPMDDPGAFDGEKVLERIRATLGIPDFDPPIHGTTRWVQEGMLADGFQAGRVFLLGDAAHRHPPMGALGLNSAIHDAHNLCWKLAAVLGGAANPDLLNTYEVERRPVDAANVKQALESAMNMFRIDAALGISPDKSSDENWAAIRPLWTDTPESPAKRHVVNKAIAAQSCEFRGHNTEFGYTYTSSAIIDDGSPAPEQLDANRLYLPSTRPGSPLPHAWVERQGRRLALGSLTADGHFLLIAGEHGDAWLEAAEKIAAETNLALRIARVTPLNAVLDTPVKFEYIDIQCAWQRKREISPSGAILVRPDRFVAFRSMGSVNDHQGALGAAFDQILRRTTNVASE